MVNEKEVDPISIKNTEKTETGVSEMKTNLKETIAVSETEEKVIQITEEAKTEENKNEEGDNEATAEEEEPDEGCDEEEMNEEHSEEEENNDENPMDENITSKDKKEEENKNDYPIEEDIAEEKKEEEMEEKAAPISTEPLTEEKNEEEMEEKAAPISKEPVKKSRKRTRKTAVPIKDKNNPKKKAKMVSVSKDKKMVAAIEEKKASEKAKTNGGPESSGQKKVGKDKPESSGKKKTGKVEGMGMIFMCSSKTKKDCYRYKVFGLPASKKDTVQKIYKGMRLFLYDVDLKLMYGIYKAAAPGGFNIEPKAFNSAYPSQVRFTVLEECYPLGEEKFKKAIEENYYSRNKFNCQLNSDQVKKLCKLFAFANKGTPKPKKAASRSVKERAEPRPSSSRSRVRQRAADERRPRSPRGTRRYVDRPVVYEREAYAPVIGPMHNFQPLPARVPALAPALSYEMDAYGRDPPLESPGRLHYEYETRRRDEIGSSGRYLYGDREPFSHQREYNYAPPAEYNYVPPAALPPRYHYPEPPSDYRSSARLQAEFHIPAEGRRAEFHIPAEGRRAEYHIPAEGQRAEYHIPAEGRRAEYHIPAEGRLAEYHIPAEGRREEYHILAEGRQKDYRSTRDRVYRL